MFHAWFGRRNGCRKKTPISCPDRPAGCNPEKTLDCLELDEEGEIEAIPHEALLAPLGFRPGKKVCLRCRARFGGPVVAEIEGRHTALGRGVARQIKLKVPECCRAENA